MSHGVRTYIGLGANVGRPRDTLPLAVRALAALPGVALEAVSPLYLTRPVGVVGQPDFLNAAVALTVPGGSDPETGALALLAGLKQLEGALGRRDRERWGPREVDLDLLLFGWHSIRVERPDGRWLEVPHAAMGQRLFVLAPLADLDPDLRPPGWDQTVGQAAERQRQLEGEDAVSRVASWDADTSDWRT